MSIDGLYTELGFEFKPSEHDKFWRELTAVARSFQQPLGAGSDSGQSGDELALLAAELGKERVGFGPRPEVVRLPKQLFTDLGYQAPVYLVELMKDFDFHLLNIPITLLPRPGGGFSQLDCIVEFNPGTEAEQRPIAYQVFPQEVWQEVIRAWQGVTVGVDEKFEFKVNPAEFVEELAQVSLPVKAEVELKASGNAGFVLGPFDYRVRTPKITSRGRGDAKVYWRLEGEDQVTQQDPRLGVILKVPKGVDRVDINAVLTARRTFHFFTSDLNHVLQYLSDRAKTFFEQGAPAAAQTAWHNVTAT